MTFKELAGLLCAKVHTCNEMLEQSFNSACGSDLMSDVLAFVGHTDVLLTGLCAMQVLRTCEMMDFTCVVFVRGKTPDREMMKIAESMGIILMTTDLRMFTSCGRLYMEGVRGE